MDNKEQNESKKNGQNQGRTPEDEIPLWLQGLEEPKSEEIKDLDSEIQNEINQSDDDWVRETTRESEPSQYEHFISEEETPIRNQTSYQQETEFEQPEEQPSFANEVLDYPQDEDNFMEISDLNISADPVPAFEMKEEMIPDDEELPDWLHEMIEEESEQPSKNLMSSFIENEDKDEPTEPVVITHETQAEVFEPTDSLQEASIEELDQVLHQEETSTKEQELLNEQELGSITAPTDFMEPEEFQKQTDVDAFPGPTPTEISKQDDVETPKTLRFAKFLLDQGDYRQAMEIIRTYTDKPAYLEKIKHWLTEAVADGSDMISDVWECLGDIALDEGDPEEAIAAYTKAITILLHSTEVHHETN